MPSDSLIKLNLRAVLDCSFQIFSNFILLLLLSSYKPHMQETQLLGLSIKTGKESPREGHLLCVFEFPESSNECFYFLGQASNS